MKQMNEGLYERSYQKLTKSTPLNDNGRELEGGKCIELRRKTGRSRVEGESLHKKRKMWAMVLSDLIIGMFPAFFVVLHFVAVVLDAADVAQTRADALADLAERCE